MKEQGETSLFSVVYCSRAREGLADPDIDDIVAAAREHNARRHITGWLTYSSGVFFQWLEGDRSDVAPLMAAISIDARHGNVVVLSEAEDVRERLFSGWDMERVSAEDIRAVLFDAIDSSTDSRNVDALRKLLSTLDDV